MFQFESIEKLKSLVVQHIGVGFLMAGLGYGFLYSTDILSSFGIEPIWGILLSVFNVFGAFAAKKELNKKQAEEKERKEKRQAEEKEAKEKRRDRLIEKYGKRHGMMIFNGEISEQDHNQALYKKN